MEGGLAELNSSRPHSRIRRVRTASAEALPRRQGACRKGPFLREAGHGLRVRAAGRGAHLGVSESGQCDVVPDSARAWGTGVTRLTQESSVVTIWDGARNYRSITLEESHKLFNPATVSVL